MIQQNVQSSRYCKLGTSCENLIFIQLLQFSQKAMRILWQLYLNINHAVLQKFDFMLFYESIIFMKLHSCEVSRKYYFQKITSAVLSLQSFAKAKGLKHFTIVLLYSPLQNFVKLINLKPFCKFFFFFFLFEVSRKKQNHKMLLALINSKKHYMYQKSRFCETLWNFL